MSPYEVPRQPNFPADIVGIAPFTVSAGPVDVTAVGTAFAVRHGTDIGVLVTEGRVTVARPTEQPLNDVTSVSLAAGDRVQVPTQAGARAKLEPKKADSLEIAEALAWRGKRVEFSDTPVAEAVALFNQQNELQLSLKDEPVGRIRLSGIFWADDPEGFARLLENGMNVRLQRKEKVITLRLR